MHKNIIHANCKKSEFCNIVTIVMQYSNYHLTLTLTLTFFVAKIGRADIRLDPNDFVFFYKKTKLQYFLKINKNVQ